MRNVHKYFGVFVKCQGQPPTGLKLHLNQRPRFYIVAVSVSGIRSSPFRAFSHPLSERQKAKHDLILLLENFQNNFLTTFILCVFNTTKINPS